MNRQEKEKLVLELSKQGKTIREIAQIVRKLLQSGLKG
jgi:hypothetical protein